MKLYILASHIDQYGPELKCVIIEDAPQMKLYELVEKGLWIKCFQNGNEIIPFNPENEKLWLEKNNKWSLIYKQK